MASDYFLLHYYRHSPSPLAIPTSRGDGAAKKKGYISDILNYKKGLFKEVIRKLADYFKVSQEAFNRPYKLVVPENAHLRNASVMNTKKKLTVA